MATLRDCTTELRARQERLNEARGRGWHDCIGSEEENVAEMRHALDVMIERNLEVLLDQAGSLELGDLPIGISLAFSKPFHDDDEPAQSLPAR
jgi:hypothetical protein